MIFKPMSFKSSIEIRLLIFEEYPCGTLNPRKQLQKLIFSDFDRYDMLVASKFIYHEVVVVTPIEHPF